MAWDHKDDDPQRRIARDLQKHVGPTWLVFWGSGSRKFWAFLRGGAHALILDAPTPQGLFDQIQRHQP
ncbi:hypothetical protein GCM10009603_08610 [Nocardiopsis exhalans]